jgi:hypothetical protein
MIRELTDIELDAVSGGIFNFFSFQQNNNATFQNSQNFALLAGIQVSGNSNSTVQVNA